MLQISDFGGLYQQLNYSIDNCIIVPRKARSEDEQGVLLGVAGERPWLWPNLFMLFHLNDALRLVGHRTSKQVRFTKLGGPLWPWKIPLKEFGDMVFTIHLRLWPSDPAPNEPLQNLYLLYFFRTINPTLLKLLYYWCTKYKLSSKMVSSLFKDYWYADGLKSTIHAVESLGVNLQ